jgi:dTMP kinase
MNASSQGLFISFEGIDGAGKTTHIGTLAEAFARHGRRVLRTREPGGTALAEKLRALVLHEPMGALTEALLVFAARCDHVQQVIVPALARGEVVLCDRFADATFAYQGAGRNFDWSTLLELESMVLRQDDGQPLQPDLTLWFDVPPAIAAQRLADARQPDKFEAESTKFFERVAAGYARRMQEAPARFARIDASCTPEQVWQQVVAVMEQKGWLA